MSFLSRALDLFHYSPNTGFPETIGYASPWAIDSHLAAIIPPTMQGSAVTVAQALRVPPVTRGTGLLSTVAASCPIVPAAGQLPAWLTATTGPIGPGHRVAQLVQDLMFHGRALLLVERTEGEITDAIRLAPALWGINERGEVTIQGRALVASTYVYIPALLPVGFLEYGQDSVTQYLALVKTINSRASNPVPLVELHITEQFDGEPEELEQAQRDWSAARQAETGAVAFTPHGIELKTPGLGAATDWLLEARNAVRLDVANFLNINAALLDGNNGTSDTYSNTLQNANEFVTFSLRTWLGPIAERLSQDDVTPEGVRVRFDTSEFDDKTGTDARGNTGDATAGSSSNAATTTTTHPRSQEDTP